MKVVWEWDFALPGLCSLHFGFLAHYPSSGLIARLTVCSLCWKGKVFVSVSGFLAADVTLAQADLELIMA